MQGKTGAAAAVLAFAGIALAVRKGGTRRQDEFLRRLYVTEPRGARYRVARFTKTMAMPRHQVAVAILAAYVLRRARVPGAERLVVAGVAAMVADRVFKTTLPRRRPRVYPGSALDESFPSGHTAATTALTLTLAGILERGGIVRPPRATLAAIGAILFVASTRLMLDEHWPTDVLAGGLLGYAIAESVGERRAPARRVILRGAEDLLLRPSRYRRNAIVRGHEVR